MAMRVPTYERREVVQAQRPVGVAARQSGFGQVARGLADVGQMFDQWQADVDEADAKAADTAFAKTVRETLYDPEQGYLYAQGGDALSRRKAAMDGLQRAYDQRLSELSPAAKEMAQRALDSRLQSANLDIDQHAGRERITYLDSQADARIQAAADDAVLNPALLDRSMQIARNEVAEKAARQGWSPEQTQEELGRVQSEVYRLTSLNMMQNDPVAAAEFVATNADKFSAVDLMNLHSALVGPLSEAAGRDAIAAAQATGGRIDSWTFAATDLPPEAYALLGTISGTESPDYQTLNGGEKFSDLRDHPRRKGQGGTTTAAGRYQFVQGTWDRVAGANGFDDFSPANQDRGAWWLAQQDYKANTGRDLSADLNAGRYDLVRKGLGSTWEGLAKLSDEEFAKRMSAGGGVSFSPQVASAINTLPGNLAAQVRETAASGVASWSTKQQAAAKAQIQEVENNVKLRIATADPTLTAQEILNLGVDDGTKATLLNSFNEKTKTVQQTRADVLAFGEGGGLRIDRYSADGKKRVDNLWNEMSSSLPDGADAGALAAGIVEQTGLVPAPIMGALRTALSGQSAGDMKDALILASRLHSLDPAAFGRREGGSEIADKVAMFNHSTGVLGLSQDEAAKQIMDLNDPQKRRERDALLKSEGAKKWIKDTATPESVRAIFDPGIFSRAPALGENELQKSAAVAEYGEILEQALFDAGGDQDKAKVLADERFRRLYGPSKYLPSGSGAVTRLPPEVTYPPGIDGSHDYIGEQARAALAEEGIVPEEGFVQSVFLQAYDDTAADVQAGRPPRYELWFVDGEGKVQRAQHPFYAEPPSQDEALAARKAEAMKERDRLMKLHEQGKELMENSPLYGAAAVSF
ncbi:hypothetical protein ACDP63_11165 [Paracoccus sp. P2]|uniref:hypothetical protein n=1 Tax=Paracoccus sp. P2 TaxID=3248840 RepID=UPI00391F41B4